MMKFGVLFEVLTEFLNIIETGFGFKGLKGDTLVQNNICYNSE
jgi:hypothetical protein